MSRAKALRTLGLQPGSSQEQVKAAYLRLAKLHHPDCAPGHRKKAAEDSFKEIAHAYSVLQLGIAGKSGAPAAGRSAVRNASPGQHVVGSPSASPGARWLIAAPFALLVCGTLGWGVHCASRSYRRAREDSPSPHPFLP